MTAEFAVLGEFKLPYAGRRTSPVELLSHPQPYLLPPCEEAVRTYKLEREQRRASGDYNPGIIIPLDIDQQRLRRVFNLNGGKSTAPLNVYNITQPFRNGDKNVIAGRVQPPGMNPHSKVVFFEQKGKEWTPLRHTPPISLEDPFVTKIDGQIILGGVRVVRTSTETQYKTVFSKGSCIEDLTEIAVGPLRMKGIRLVQLRKGIGVFTRPHDRDGGGQIGYTEIDSLDKLNPTVIANAPLINQRFPKGEWGGVNEAHTLRDGRILALGHRAYFDEVKNKHYYPWHFIFDPITKSSIDLGIIGASDDFPQTNSRANDLDDVYYPVAINLEKREIYGGIRDAMSATQSIAKLLEPHI